MTERKERTFSIIEGKKGQRMNEDVDLVDLDEEDENLNELEEAAFVSIDGDQLRMESFVLSGESKEGKRVVFTYRCDPDEMLQYLKTLEILVNEKFKQLMELGE